MGIFDFLRKRDDRTSDGPPDDCAYGPEVAAAGQGAGASPDGIRMVSVALPVRSERRGDLDDLTALDLPAGRAVRPDGDPEATAVAWVTEDVADHSELWARLVQAFPQSGLWPVIASGMDGKLNRPWFDGELGGREVPARMPKPFLGSASLRWPSCSRTTYRHSQRRPRRASGPVSRQPNRWG